MAIPDFQRPEALGPLPPDDNTAPTRDAAVATSPREWIAENLFNTPYNSLLTVVFGLLLGFGAYRGLRFVFVTARWDVIDRNLTNLMVWLWPQRPDIVRPWIAVFVAAATFGFLAGRAVRTAAEREADDPRHPVLPMWRESARRGVRRLWPVGLLLGVIGWASGSAVTIGLILGLVAVVIAFRAVGLRVRLAWSRASLTIGVVGILASFGSLVWFGGHGWGQWGGFMLTLFLAAGGIALSLPFGVALALGRRSSFPVVRLSCVAYIELIRGVPLITLLLMGSFMLGLFLPPAISDLSLVTRSLVALTLFTAAYVAEIVRGGLQSVPTGQVEAGQALGLSPLKQMRLIVLPQALRNVIPALVGQLISLYKDTSLVGLVGGFEVLRVSRTITSQGEFVGQGLLAETLVFASLLYWVVSYTMSRESQRLERRLGLGER